MNTIIVILILCAGEVTEDKCWGSWNTVDQPISMKQPASTNHKLRN